ncbi:MAG TPA: substrate-binding domain-containing protein [Pseudobacteroides sp.]|uniref:stalk domain-containing protein n=1 Tax=Pseudobacteroides sp. TaxID=1968840 RepID=UPI002F959099
MKKLILVLLLAASILFQQPVYSSNVYPQSSIKLAISQYFDYRYKMLSSLSSDEGFKSLLDLDIAKDESMPDEADILNTIIEYRKSQYNDLRMKKFSYNIVYENIETSEDKAILLLSENADFYFNCAPTVKNSQSIDHKIILKKSDGKWLVLSDDYIDNDGIKKLFQKYFTESTSSILEIKKKVLDELKNQSLFRLSKLESIMEGFDKEICSVLFVGKPIAYNSGTVGEIEKGSGLSPVVINGRTLLPMRYICEGLGAKVDWDDSTKTAVIKSDNFSMTVKPGVKSMIVDGSTTPLDVPAQIISDRILLPLRAIANAAGKNVFWDERGLIILCGKEFDISKNTKLIEDLAGFYESLYTKTDFPRIDGSTATYPLSMEMGKELLGMDDTGVKGFITHNTTHNAYINLINKKADIIFVTKPSKEELDLAKKSGIELDVIPICKEGFVFLTNINNPVRTLTSKQIRDIYQGKITNWKEVGGDDAAIIPYQREPNSGSQTLMESVVMNGLTLTEPPKEHIVIGMGDLIDRVADFSNAKNSLGYSVYYYASQMYTSRDVKFLAVDNVEPNKQSIKEGKYPFIVNYYAVLRKDETGNSNARKLLKWLLSSEGQNIVDKSGLVPVKN